MGNLHISAYARSNVGKKRGNNEDNFFLSGVTVDSAIDITATAKESEEAAFAVFDGMGGEAAGEKASQITAVTYGQKSMSMLSGDFSPEVMQNTIEAANNKVCAEIRAIGKRMGCTFASVGFKNDNIYVSNVGDSRVYLLRDGVLHCVSKDHTVAQTMVEAGIVSYEDSQHSKEKHQLTQHIGIFPEEMIIEPFYNTIKANNGDKILVCSDGLTDMLSDAEICAILASDVDEERLSNALVEAALQKGGKDNVTVIVAKIMGEDTSPVVSASGSKMKLLATIGSIVAVLVAGVVLFLLLTGKEDKSKKENSDKTSAVTVQSTVVDDDTTVEDAPTDNAIEATDTTDQTEDIQRPDEDNEEESGKEVTQSDEIQSDGTKPYNNEAL